MSGLEAEKGPNGPFFNAELSGLEFEKDPDGPFFDAVLTAWNMKRAGTICF